MELVQIDGAEIQLTHHLHWLSMLPAQVVVAMSAFARELSALSLAHSAQVLLQRVPAEEGASAILALSLAVPLAEVVVTRGVLGLRVFWIMSTAGERAQLTAHTALPSTAGMLKLKLCAEALLALHLNQRLLPLGSPFFREIPHQGSPQTQQLLG